MQSAALAAAGLLLIGVVLRARLRFLQLAFIPASVAGGLIGLALVQSAGGLVSQAPAGTVISTIVTWVARDCPATLRGWPGWLIAVVFAGLLLDRPAGIKQGGLRRVASEGVMVWVIVLGQAALGLLATWLVVPLLFPAASVPASFGLLIEAGWAGGHSTAAAMGKVFESTEQWSVGGDLAQFMATVGLGWSVVSGIAWTNLAVRRGWTRVSVSKLAGQGVLEDVEARPAIGRGVVRADVLDPLAFQLVLLAVAFAIGLALWSLTTQVGVSLVGGLEGTVAAETLPKLERSVGNLPLFVFTLLGGLALRAGLDATGLGHLVDGESMRRLTAVAMEFLVVAAIASLRVEAVIGLAGPLAVLIAVAVAWTAFCLLWIGPRLLAEDRWLELGLINYGMSTGTTATGLMLLRIVDKELETGAAEDYALAAPLSAPFVGGGLLTLMLPVILLSVPLGAVATGLAAAVVLLFFVGRRLR